MKSAPLLLALACAVACCAALAHAGASTSEDGAAAAVSQVHELVPPNKPSKDHPKTIKYRRRRSTSSYSYSNPSPSFTPTPRFHSKRTHGRYRHPLYTRIGFHPYERLDYYYHNFYRPYYGGFPFGGYTLGSIYKPY